MNTSELIKTNDTPVIDISKHVWNSLLPSLKLNTKTVPLDNTVAYKYRFDFFGLLQHLGIPVEYIYPNIIVNDYKVSTDFSGTTNDVVIIDAQYLHRLYSKINSTV